ncbi:MAG: HlyC/CorC family transporter, partial [Oscillospiraceae bacterium]|nr:HlyC/CorC family transporter [Oscillospiraceae bacterium]
FEIYGEVSLNSLKRYFNSRDIELEISSEAHTVAGWVLELFGNIPKNGDTHDTDEFTVTVLDAASLRVNKVKLELKSQDKDD